MFNTASDKLEKHQNKAAKLEAMLGATHTNTMEAKKKATDFETKMNNMWNTDIKETNIADSIGLRGTEATAVDWKKVTALAKHYKGIIG